MKIGIDVDGVVADFNGNFIDRVIDVTGEDKFPARPFDIVTWNYPESYGYTGEQCSAVWEVIKKDPTFWVNLSPYDESQICLEHLASLVEEGHEIYFVTNRPGVMAKLQTEDWLNNNGFNDFPTVLISAQKGEVAKALELDWYVDDKTGNILDVHEKSPNTNAFLLGRSWNANDGVPVLGSLSEFLRMVDKGIEVGA